MFNSTLKKLQSKFATITDETFHRQIWQEALTEAFKKEKRFSRLSEFLEHEISLATDLITAINPTEKLTLDEYALFQQQTCLLAQAEFFKTVIDSENCTTEMFDNIESAVNLYFKAEFSDFLDTYV